MNEISPEYNETIQNIFSNDEFSDYMFYGCVLSKCDVIFSDVGAVAAVSFNKKYKLHINKIEFKQYSLLNRLAIIKHEMLHILNGHLIERMNGKDVKIWNIATDCAINQLIDKNHLPSNCITTDYIEKILKKKIKKNQLAEYYYDLLYKEKDYINSLNSELLNTYNHNEWENSIITEDISDETTEIIENSLDDINSIGNIPKECSTWFNLKHKKPKIKWKSILKNLLRTNNSNNKKRTIFKRNRRQPARLDLKGKIKEKEQTILYIIDASGSVNNTEFKKLNSEIISMCNELNIEINAIQVDTEASEPEKLSKFTNKIERKRNSGTYLSSGILKANECKLNYDTIIISTDGYLMQEDIKQFIKTKRKIIFLISPNGSEKAFKRYKKSELIYIKLPKT